MLRNKIHKKGAISTQRKLKMLSRDRKDLSVGKAYYV